MSNTDKYRNRLINLLKELFQLDQPELDFGFYKIMHAKSVQISRFLEQDLLDVIKDAFGEVDEQRLADAKARHEAAIEQAKKFGAPDPEQTDGVKEAKAQYEQAKDGGNAESEIYDHLYRFFERYYDNGDFMSRRYYARESDSRAAPYAVPYDGREVYLHWANKDQYYIKSSEHLSNYSFDLNEAIRQQAQSAKTPGLEQFASHDEQPLKVHFRIVDASEGEHGNIKATVDQKRFFLIHAAKPVELLPFPQDEGDRRVDKRSASTDTEELMVDAANALSTLHINFEYRTDPDKTGQDAKWQETRLQQAEVAIIQALQDLSASAFLQALQTPAPTDSKDKRTLLGKYLQKYAARNTRDYFIHKDLGGFLRRELDFYIKNEIMRLDDIDNADAPQVQSYLSKIRVLRKIAQQLIAFLAQLEEFQKKLWLKKKFVTECHYCITLDRIDAKFYPEIAANDRQREEWVKLFAIDEIAGDLATPGYTEPLTVEFLAANPYLLVDTALFSADFQQLLLAEIADLDAQCDGVLIHSENFHALELMQEKYREQVKCIYIDPPYNTGQDGFNYKDAYQHSSWMTLISDRVESAVALLQESGVFLGSIDDIEVNRLRKIFENFLGQTGFLGSFVWKRRITSSLAQSWLSTDHEYVMVYSKNASKVEILGDEKDKSKYNKDDGDGRKYASMPLTVGMNRFQRPNQWYALINPNTKREYWPPENRVWCYYPPTMEQKIAEKRIIWPDDYPDSKMTAPRLKSYIDESQRDKKPISTWINEINESSEFDEFVSLSSARNEEGTKWLNALFGMAETVYPKPISLLSSLTQQFCSNGSFVLDFFAGSGTTAHANINLNRGDNGNRKYILVEQNNYFDTVLKPRIQKVVYSKNWKDGKPISREGISHCFKYLRLESYEDVLNNLVFREDEARERALDNNPELRRDYLLNYFLDVETQGSQSLLNVAAFRDPFAYQMWLKKPGSESQTLQSVDLVETFNWLIGLWVSHKAAPQGFSAEFVRETDPDLPQDQNTRLRCTRLKPVSPGDFGGYPEEHKRATLIRPTGGDGDESGGCATLIHPTGSDNGRVDKAQAASTAPPNYDQPHYWLRLVEGYTLKVPGDPTSKIPTLIVWRKLTSDPEKDNAVLQTYLLDKLQISPREQTYGAIYVNGSHTLPNPVFEGEQIKVRLIEEAFHAAMWSGE